MKGSIRWIANLLPLCLLCCAGTALAVQDLEPNNSCSAPQKVGAFDSGQIVGAIATASDVDFFKATSANPGHTLDVRLTPKATDDSSYPIYDALLGVFDSACQQLASVEAYYSDAVIRLQVPADGKYLIAVSSWPDYQFNGSGYYAGGYQVSVAPAPGKISGTLSNLNGAYPGYYTITLYKCPSSLYEYCSQAVMTVYPDAYGYYEFNGTYLESGASYQIAAAPYYESSSVARSAVFTLGTDDLAVDLALKSPSMSVALAWSSSSVIDGGVAALTASINNSSSKKTVDLWLAVNASPTGSALGISDFQQGGAGTTKAVPVQATAKAGKITAVPLSFAVPVSALSGSSGYVTVYASQTGQPANVYAVSAPMYYEVVPDGSVALLNAEQSLERARQQQRSRERTWFQHDLQRREAAHRHKPNPSVEQDGAP